MTRLRGKAKAKSRKKDQLVQKRRKEKYFAVLVEKIVKYDDPILKETCEPVLSKKELPDIIHELKKTVCATKNGVGISAPQLGITKRVFVVRFDTTTNKMEVFVNPEIVEESEIKLLAKEGCLSYPDIYCDVERPFKIRIKYKDHNYANKEKWFSGLSARIICHENDHLNGECKIAEEYFRTRKKDMTCV
jgi:peptide deformylase